MDEVLGEEWGDDDWSQMEEVVGVARPAVRRPPALRAASSLLRVQPAPQWRRAVSPGVAAPGVGLQPLPLTPSNNNGVFTSAVTAITWSARPQRPFRAERLIAIVARSAGVPATTRALASGIFVGTQLQQVDLGSLDLEIFGTQAFGVRLNLVQATPGMLIQIPVNPSAAIAAMESLSVTLVFLGRAVR